DNPRDALSVAAALRSPFLGCDDQDLFLYVAAEPGGSFDYLREAERLPEGSPLGDAFRFLSDLHHLRNDRSPATTVDEILQRTGALALLLLGPQGDQRVANLAKLVDLARQHEIASGGGFRSFVAFLSSMVEQEHQEAESPTAEEDAALVRLMTVHQAKGLEFPIVVLADAAARPGHARGVHPDRRHGRYHFSLSLDEGGPRAGSWGFEEVDGREKEFSAAEQVRLLYVAATRARDHLIIPVVPPAGRYDSFLKLLREAGAIPDELRPGTCPAPGSAAALCRVLDCAGLDTSTPPPRQFRLDRDLPEQAARADEALLLERSAWKEDLGRALAAAARGRPIRVASALEGRILDAASAGGEAASLRPGAAGSGARPRERRLLVGAAVHAVLEAVPPVGAAAEIPLRAALAAEAARAGLTEEERREAERLVRAAYRSSLPSRAARAGRCEVEYPFAVTIGEEEGEPVLLEGRIDLLLVGDDGCVVIDYKTDRLGDGADSERILAERVALYRPQAAAYAAALAAAGARVRSVVLLFLDTGREVSLEADHALLALGRRAALSPPPPGRTDPPRG
ncbi:MAG: 3'-5' exonuclease, partial [Acidobacteriota bacterium]